MKTTLKIMMAIIGLTASALNAAEPNISATPQPSSGATDLYGNPVIIPATTVPASDHILAGDKEHSLTLQLPENGWCETISIVYTAAKDNSGIILHRATSVKHLDPAITATVDYDRKDGMKVVLSKGSETKNLALSDKDVRAKFASTLAGLKEDYTIAINQKTMATETTTLKPTSASTTGAKAASGT